MMAVFLMPCADSFGTEDFSASNTIANSIDHQTHDHTETEDFCSPFCLCNCCGIAKIVDFRWNAYQFDDVKIVELTIIKPEYVSQFVSHYLGEIWQPPQLNS